MNKLATRAQGQAARAPSHRSSVRRRAQVQAFRTRRPVPISRARSLLKRFRKASIIAVAITSLILLLVDPTGSAASELAVGRASAVLQERARASGATTRDAEGEVRAPSPAEVAHAAGDEANRTLSGLKALALRNAPKFILVVALFGAAWLAVRGVRALLRRLLGNWPRASALMAVTGLSLWTITIAISVTVLAGDIRAFLGSVGLLGLAASWALQTPIESFTGWLLNAFRGYYRVGDRVEVGEVFGDVHRIDVLTTTVWEIGSPFRPGFVRAEQPTGRLITFPNNQILTGSIMNLTRDFEFVWDELAVSVANESDLRYALSVLDDAARELFGSSMGEAAARYERILQRSGLEQKVAAVPEVFVSPEDSWTTFHVRYLVHARARRKHKTELVLFLSDVLSRPEHAGRIIPVLPRRQLQFLDANGRPSSAPWFRTDNGTDVTHGA